MDQPLIDFVEDSTAVTTATKNKSKNLSLIRFELKPPDWDVSHGPLTAIGMTPERLRKDLPYLQKARTRVIHKRSIKVLIQYPLSHEVTVTLKAPNRKYFTLAQLIRGIAHAYQKIYREEARTSTVPEETYQKRAQRQGKKSGLINRAPTHGKYGIYGHDLGDLMLVDIAYDERSNVYLLGVDS